MKWIWTRFFCCDLSTRLNSYPSSPLSCVVPPPQERPAEAWLLAEEGIWMSRVGLMHLTSQVLQTFDICVFFFSNGMISKPGRCLFPLFCVGWGGWMGMIRFGQMSTYGSRWERVRFRYIGYIWANYSDLTRPISPKWWFSKGNPRLFQENLGWWNIIPFG